MNYNTMTKAQLIKILEVRDRPSVKTTSNAYDLVKHYGMEDQEFFVAISLDSNLKAIKVHEITRGLVNRTLAHPREVFRPAISDNATAIIVAHNHPSDNLAPSTEDMELTDRLKKAGQLLGIEILDHMILGLDSYYSMREEGNWY